MGPRNAAPPLRPPPADRADARVPERDPSPGSYRTACTMKSNVPPRDRSDGIAKYRACRLRNVNGATRVIGVPVNGTWSCSGMAVAAGTSRSPKIGIGERQLRHAASRELHRRRLRGVADADPRLARRRDRVVVPIHGRCRSAVGVEVRQDAELDVVGNRGAEHRAITRRRRLRVWHRPRRGGAVGGARTNRQIDDLLGLESRNGGRRRNRRAGQPGIDIHRHTWNAVDDEHTGRRLGGAGRERERQQQGDYAETRTWLQTSGLLQFDRIRRGHHGRNKRRAAPVMTPAGIGDVCLGG